MASWVFRTRDTNRVLQIASSIAAYLANGTLEQKQGGLGGQASVHPAFNLPPTLAEYCAKHPHAAHCLQTGYGPTLIITA